MLKPSVIEQECSKSDSCFGVFRKTKISYTSVLLEVAGFGIQVALLLAEQIKRPFTFHQRVNK